MTFDIKPFKETPMLSFKQFIKEIWNLDQYPDEVEESLNESLSRVLDHTKHRNIAIISAKRGGQSDEENAENHKQLKRDIRHHGYGYIHVRGRGNESGKVSEEPSFLVIGAKGKKDDLLKHAKAIGRKYGQDSILHKPHDSKEATVHNTSDRPKSWPAPGKKESVGEWHPNKAADFLSTLSRNQNVKDKKGKNTGRRPKGKREVVSSKEKGSFTFEDVHNHARAIYTEDPSFFSRATTLF